MGGESQCWRAVGGELHRGKTCPAAHSVLQSSFSTHQRGKLIPGAGDELKSTASPALLQAGRVAGKVKLLTLDVSAELFGFFEGHPGSGLW